MSRAIRVLFIVATLATGLQAGELRYKERFSTLLIKSVPRILQDYDSATGHFGKGIWICTDQNQMYPLAVAYALDVPGNKYHKDPQVLEAIMKAGDALIADADEQGRWVFRKKDGSEWGMIFMPWTYSRWMRSFELIREDMPADRRAHWEKALLHGFEGIRKTQFGGVANIPTHHAMGLYVAGRTFGQKEWCDKAAAFMHKVIGLQSENGYWSEGAGPVVNYNFVYVEAVGIYYALSHDPVALEAISRASVFHRNFTYPDGSNVETVDQRNPYHDRVWPGNVGFTFDKIGRTYLAQQWSRMKDSDFNADFLAAMMEYGEEGPTEDEPADGARVWVMKEKGVEQAMTIRQGPWFVCISALTTPLSNSRWHQDRQNMVSIYHDKVGLLIGGGNTKLQPAWSNFTVGDMGLLKHKPADTNPAFAPAGELYHIPSKGVLVHEPLPGVDLTYGPETCRIRVAIKDAQTLEYRLSTTTTSGLPVLAHVTLLPHMKQVVKTAAGEQFTLADEKVELDAKRVGGWIDYAGCRVALPNGVSLHWPMLPHNPYRIDGRAEAAEGRVEIRVPFSKKENERRLVVSVEEE